MKFPRSQSEHLTEYLRASIARGELPDPLPNTRAWSIQLGVSRPTLLKALKPLQREGLLSVQTRRGARLRKPPAFHSRSSPAARHVRILYYGRDYPSLAHDLEMFLPLSEALHAESIHFSLERCSEARLRSISEGGERPNQMLMLLSLASPYQKFFAHWRHSVLLIGKPAPGMDLPFVRFDVTGTVRHATMALLQKGCSTVHLVINRGSATVISETIEMFRSMCETWGKQPVRANVVTVPLEVEMLVRSVHRFVSQLRTGQGVVVVRPVPVAVLLTALRASALRAAAAIDVVTVSSNPDVVKSCPSLSHYPYPLESFIKSLTRAALRYFQTGVVPPLRKVLVTECVPAVG